MIECSKCYATGDELADFIIDGEPASKANSRRLVVFRNKPRLIKSKKALDYSKNFIQQCPHMEPLIGDDVAVRITIWYASRRPDLDESLILDLMQGAIYANDRQVKIKHIGWQLDRERPRTHIRVYSLAGCNRDCFG